MTTRKIRDGYERLTTTMPIEVMELIRAYCLKHGGYANTVLARAFVEFIMREKE